MIYVMSDIHGNIERFNSIMKQINLQDNDTLYILGDVIDRYPDGIEILMQIMSMPNVKMLLGNHEHMMLSALCPEKISDNYELSAMRIWYRNGGATTHEEIMSLPESTRDEIFNYLINLPINIKIDVDGLKYLLVHGSPIENYRESCSTDYNTEEMFALWERWSPYDSIPDGYSLIFGHTPTPNFQNYYPFDIYVGEKAIGIDCGCGSPNGRLACIRLDDLKVYYSDK